MVGFDPSKAKLTDRTETSDVFTNEDGSQTHVISADQVNFKDGLGQWQKVDNKLRRVGDRIVPGSGPVGVSFAVNSTASDLVSIGDSVTGMQFAPEGASAAEPVIKDNTITYPSIVNGADLRYTVTAHGVREEIVLSDASEKQPAFRFKFASRGISSEAKSDGSFDFKGPDGKALFTMPKGRSFEEKATNESDVAVSLEPDAVVVTPDASWLNSSKRQFPVVVDPDVVFGGMGTDGDTYISSLYPSSNFNGSSVDKIGTCAANDENYTYVKWDLSSLSGKLISSAHISMIPYTVPAASVTAVQPIRLWHTAQDWNVNTFTRSAAGGTPPQGNHDSIGKDLYGVNATGTQFSFDMTDFARNWTSGMWPNYGVSMDAGGNPNACWTIQSAETGSGPRLVINTDPDTGRRDFFSYFDQTIDANTGLSVNLANGNLNLSVADIQAPGIGQDLKIERNWSSLRASAGTREFGSAPWQYGTTQARIVPTLDKATVYLPGMSPVTFMNKPGGGYVMPPGINADLTTVGTGASTVFTLKFFRDASSWVFWTLGDGTGRAILHSQADRNGNTITYNYDTPNPGIGSDNWPKLTSIIDTFGQTVNFTYTGNVISKATDWTGRYVNYVQSGGRLLRSEDVTLGWQTYGYDSNGLVNFVQTPAHRGLQFTYDTSGRVTSLYWYGSSTYGTNPTWSFAYTPLTNGFGTTTLTDPNGKVTTYTWDATGKVTNTKDPRGYNHSQAWTPNNDTASTTTGTGDTTNMSYDATTNNLMSVQAPTSGTTEARRV